MITTLFRFKHFTIIQEKSAQKVGTDGVLLGALAKGANAMKMLDIGTGTGLIALMLAQRFIASVDAVEIDFDAAHEASENARNSPWNNRIRVINESFQKFALNCNTKYQLIVTNPPFFNNSLKSDDHSRNMARHNDSLTTAEIMEGVNRILSHDGIFQIIIPSQNYADVIKECLAVDLFCQEVVWIKPTPEKNPKRVILSFSKFQNQTNEFSLIVEQNGRHQYSDEYKRITKDFYLAF